MLRSDQSNKAQQSKTVQRRHPGFTVSNSSFAPQAKAHIPLADKPETSSAVKGLNRDGYIIYNVPEATDIYVSISSDSADFDQSEPKMIKAEPGKFVGSPDITPNMQIIRAESYSRDVQYSEASDIFQNARRRETIDDVDFGEIVVKKDEFKADISMASIEEEKSKLANLKMAAPIKQGDMACTSAAGVAEVKQEVITFHEIIDQDVEENGNMSNFGSSTETVEAEDVPSAEETVLLTDATEIQTYTKIVTEEIAEAEDVPSAEEAIVIDEEIVEQTAFVEAEDVPSAEETDVVEADTTEIQTHVEIVTEEIAEAEDVPSAGEAIVIDEEIVEQTAFVEAEDVPSAEETDVVEADTTEIQTHVEIVTEEVVEQIVFDETVECVVEETMEHSESVSTPVGLYIEGEKSNDVAEIGSDSEDNISFVGGDLKTEMAMTSEAISMPTVPVTVDTEETAAVEAESIAEVISEETLCEVKIFDIEDPVEGVLKITVPELSDDESILADFPQDVETFIPEDGMEAYDAKFIFVKIRRTKVKDVGFDFNAGSRSSKKGNSVNFSF